jgi:hypothetical protein
MTVNVASSSVTLSPSLMGVFGKNALLRPFVAEHRPDDLVLARVVGGDGVDHALGRDDRDVVPGHEQPDSGVVIGM